MPQKKWDEARTLELKTYIDLRYSGGATAEAMGLTPGSVVGKAHRMGWRFLSADGGQSVKLNNNRNPSRPVKPAKIVGQPAQPSDLTTCAPLNIPMWDLTIGQCKYPVGPASWKSHTTHDGMACGLPVSEHVYCVHHHAMCHTRQAEGLR